MEDLSYHFKKKSIYFYNYIGFIVSFVLWFGFVNSGEHRDDVTYLKCWVGLVYLAEDTLFFLCYWDLGLWLTSDYNRDVELRLLRLTMELLGLNIILK